MKLKNTLLAVTDIGKSVEFYKNVLGLRLILDFGANKTLSGGLCLQTLDTWKNFINTDKISFYSNNAEVYFEEDDFDAFAARLESHNINYVHKVREHEWGQRVVRLYDPDGHIIEVGENLKIVCRRFLDNGMSAEQTAVRMGVPLKYVIACIK